MVSHLTLLDIENQHYESFLNTYFIYLMAIYTNNEDKRKKMVSYSVREAKSLNKKEQELMDHYRWNYSQLHKNLVLDRYSMLNLT